VADCKVDEVADGIYRNSTYLPDVVAAQGLTINPFLVLADEPLLVHTGLRTTFPETVAAVARLVPLERLRWLSFGHVEADECGALNHYLAAARQLEVAFGALGCRVWLDHPTSKRRASVASSARTADPGRGQAAC
jgi:flavorubredoxin